MAEGIKKELIQFNMIKYITLYLAFFSFAVSAQMSSCDYLERAITHFQNKELDSAIVLMITAVEETPDTTSCYGRCFNNIPLAYAMLEDFDNAIIWFNKILDSDLDDMEPGTDIMEFYANYHHNACMKLVQVNEILENRHEALKYLDLAETKYPFETFSGTSYEKRAVSIAKWKAQLYEELNLPDSALYVQLNKILDTDIFYRKSDFDSFSDVSFYHELVHNVKEQIGKEQFDSEMKQLKKSIKKLKINPSGDMRVAVFTYRDLEYKVGISNKDKTRKEIIARLMDNELFD